jgi:hypothetical protein
MFYSFSEPGEEESSWGKDVYDVEPKVMEAAEDLGFEIEGVKRYAVGPSPREPVERQVTNYVVFDDHLKERGGRFCGVRAEYTPFKLKLQRVPEDDIAGFLKPGGVAVGGLEADRANDRASIIGSIYKRKDYEGSLAEEVIEMTETKMDLGVPEPGITDFRNEEHDIFAYSYELDGESWD